MIRKLPNLSIVLPADSEAKPWKVELRKSRMEHLDYGPGMLKSRETFTVHLVGRYASIGRANRAAMNSAQRNGGFARIGMGSIFPTMPFPVPMEKEPC